MESASMKLKIKTCSAIHLSLAAHSNQRFKPEPDSRTVAGNSWLIGAGKQQQQQQQSSTWKIDSLHRAVEQSGECRHGARSRKVAPF